MQDLYSSSSHSTLATPARSCIDHTAPSRQHELNKYRPAMPRSGTGDR